MVKHPYSYIFLFCLFCFVPFLGSYHLFDWDEINFAECAREMIITGLQFISRGESPRNIQDQLVANLPPKEKQKLLEEAAAG